MSEFDPPTPPEGLERPTIVWVERPHRPTRNQYLIAFALLAATFFTTVVVGVRLDFNYSHKLGPFAFGDNSLPMFPLRWILEHPSRLLAGWPFAVAVMGILLAHELGHYGMCRIYGVDATPPYFIPAPTLIGTMGAFIKIRSAFPSRRALFDIGIAGPIAGFIVAVPICFLGLLWSYPVATMPSGPTDIQLGLPLLFDAIHTVFVKLHLQPHEPLEHFVLHPLAVAGWTGGFATALNLLPGGQLDGGHIVFSWSERAHRVVSWIALLALIPLAYFCWAGWLMWGVVLYITSRRQPVVQGHGGLGVGRKCLAIVALAMLLVSINPAPILGSSIESAHDEMRKTLYDVRDVVLHFLKK